MKTNTQSLTVGQLQSNSLQPSEILNARLKTATEVRNILESGKMLSIEVASEAVKVVNGVYAALYNQNKNPFSQEILDENNAAILSDGLNALIANNPTMLPEGKEILAVGNASDYDYAKQA